MEETIINEPTLFQVLVSSPTTYILLLVIVLTIIGLKMEKSSPKCCGSNKTSSSKPKRARGKKGKYLADDPKTAKNEAWKGGKAPKKKATKKTPAKKAPAKKTPAKKTPAKKAVKKRTPKKGGK
jgi:hypothetical protein